MCEVVTTCFLYWLSLSVCMRYESTLDVAVSDVGDVADYLHEEHEFRRPDVGEDRAYVLSEDEHVRLVIQEDMVEVYHDHPVDDVALDAFESVVQQVDEYGESGIDVDGLFDDAVIDVPEVWRDGEGGVYDASLHDEKYMVTREP